MKLVCCPKVSQVTMLHETLLLIISLDSSLACALAAEKSSPVSSE